MSKLQATAEIIGGDLTGILGLFKPGAKIALAVWFPGKPDVDFILIHPDASINEVIGVFERRRDDPETITGQLFDASELLR